MTLKLCFPWSCPCGLKKMECRIATFEFYLSSKFWRVRYEVLSHNSTQDLECIYENSSGRTSLQHAVDQILEKDEEVQVKKEALFILNLKEIRGLSEAAVDRILGETSKMFRHSLGRIEAGVIIVLPRMELIPVIYQICKTSLVP